MIKGWEKIHFTKNLLKNLIRKLRNLFLKSSQKNFMERPKRMRKLLRKSLFSSKRSSGNPESSFDNPTEKSSPADRKIFRWKSGKKISCSFQKKLYIPEKHSSGHVGWSFVSPSEKLAKSPSFCPKKRWRKTFSAN